MTDIVERLRHASLQTDYGLDIDKELMDEGWREIERLTAAIRGTAGEGTYNELAIRKAVSFELAEMIVDARRALDGEKR